MGKSNNSEHELKKICQYDKHLHDFLPKQEIQVLENVNKIFIYHMKKFFFSATRENVKLTFSGMKIKTNYKNSKTINNFMYFNLIEVLPLKNQFLLMLSSNFLSVITDVLFGGNGNLICTIKDQKNITFTENWINKKITKAIIESFSYACKNFFLVKIKCNHVRMFMDHQNIHFDKNDILLTNNFDIIIGHTDIFFSFAIPLSIIKKLHKKNIISLEKNMYEKNDIQKKISLSDISHIELEIITKWIDIHVSYNQFYDLSIGDVLSIQRSNTIVSYVDSKPVFFGDYKIFNERSVIFVKKFINDNLQSNKILRNDLVKNTQKQSVDIPLIDDDKKSINLKPLPKDTVVEKLDNSEVFSNNKKILLDTTISISVELGKSKIKIKDFLNFSQGSILILDKFKEEPLDIFINDSLVASGEMVTLENKYGLRITSIKKSLKTKNTLL